MRTPNEVEDRIRALLVEELDRRMADASQRLPVKCTHNHRQSLDNRRKVEGDFNPTFNRISTHQGLPVVQTIGLCMLNADRPEDWQGTICEDPIDAQRCPYFDPKISKDDVWDGFVHDLSDADWVQLNLPQVHELRWVIAEEKDVQLPWWKKILFRFARIRIPNALPPFEPAKLLPSPVRDSQEAPREQ